MRTFAAAAAVVGILFAVVGDGVGDEAAWSRLDPGAEAPPAIRSGLDVIPFSELMVGTRKASIEISDENLTTLVRRTCSMCHNDRLLTGSLSLTGFDVSQASSRAETSEKIINKLRAGMMPPPGVPVPGGDSLLALVETLEDHLDEAAALNPNPGTRPFQRLNRAEYARSIEDLLGLQIDAGTFLPLDAKSANFDNIADVQLLSPTLLDAYLNAAAQITRLALGDRRATPTEATYEKSGYNSQWDWVQGAPFGTRGGMSELHNFPADGEYIFRLAFDHTTTGGYFGSTQRFERLEVSIDGERVALLEMDQWMDVSDPNGVNMETLPIFVAAGPHRVSAAFPKRFEGPVEDLTSPHEWSLADRQIGAGGYGITALPHLKEMIIAGPSEVLGISETPSRQLVFSCRPETPAEAAPCAESILGRLAGQAYRRPVSDRDVSDLMAFYEEGAEDGGFEGGIQLGLQAILASPDFVFRYEPSASGYIVEGETYRISDLALASRLSFFLWGSPPDEELMGLAAAGRLSDEVLEQQVHRMLDDPRSEALGVRFASQWLRLQDLDKVRPDAFWFPDYDQQLADAFVEETQQFFSYLVREDRSLLDLYDADYSFMNERVARHYGISGVTGSEFRKVEYPDGRRGGLLGHGSVLTLTSHANRTSPVLRGKWVMEVLMGTPPPPPPPGVPDLDETDGSTEGRFLTTRERMEQHRANPACSSCHIFMDPIGLALDNFDVTGRWRIRENDMPLDTQGEYYDGTPVTRPQDLRAALLARPIPLIRTFTENLMAYGLGRRVEFYDKPTVRQIARDAEKDGFRMSSFIMGVVKSDAFQMKKDVVVQQQ